MQRLPISSDPNLLVGPEHFSDAGVYRIDEHTAIVQSLDFFPPIVNDPYVFGQIAAANSLSDLYAVGAQPRTALNIVGFPDTELDADVLHEILRGGSERVAAAGAVILGGHSVRDAEVKYGLAVTGVVDPAKMLTNSAAKAGDALVLTKALGTGFITSASRADDCPPEILEAACRSMIALNRAASETAVALDASAATDVTGFGLAGHAAEMASASGVTIRIELAALPLLPGAETAVRGGHFTRANASTREYLGASIRVGGEANAPRAEILFDPQTSGGLLIAIPPDRAETLVERCRATGDDAGSACVIGSVDAAGNAGVVAG